MRNPGGWAIMTEPGKATIERDTITCNHCNVVVHINPQLLPQEQNQFRVIEAEKCRMCMRHVCPVCMGKMNAGHGCKVFEKKVEEHEARGRLLKAVLG